jgi:hypothetical protein
MNALAGVSNVDHAMATKYRSLRFGTDRVCPITLERRQNLKSIAFAVFTENARSIYPHS